MPETKKRRVSRETVVTKEDIKEIKQLISKNHYQLNKLEHSVRKFERFILVIKVKAAVKTALILIPLVLAYFYVVPWARELLEQYRQALSPFIS
jgi:hypothetical protein